MKSGGIAFIADRAAIWIGDYIDTARDDLAMTIDE
jgi:hypothetical protein